MLKMMGLAGLFGAMAEPMEVFAPEGSNLIPAKSEPIDYQGKSMPRQFYKKRNKKRRISNESKRRNRR